MHNLPVTSLDVNYFQVEDLGLYELDWDILTEKLPVLCVIWL